MASGVQAFKADLAKWADVVNQDIADVLRYVALDLFNRITQKNPVDTGYSRSQWRLSEGSPDTTVDEPPARTKDRAGTFDIPVADLAALANVTPQSIIYVTNSVNYIQYLEEGSSQKAPNGMIRISIAEVASNIDADIARAA